MGTPKPPTQQTLKAFFKLLSLDLAVKAKAELERGLSPDVAFDAGHGAQTALMYALARDKRACVRVLLEAGADVRATGERGGTALHEVSDVGFAKDLLARGADLDARTRTGDTPLHAACAAGHRPLVELLVQRGATVEIANTDGKTPYAVARDAGIRAFLKQHGAKGFGAGGGVVITPQISKASWQDLELARGTLGVDREGHAWFASDSGLFRFDGEQLTRHQFEQSFAFDSIAAGPPSVVYFATSWGLLALNGGTFTLYSSDNSELFDNHLVYLRCDPEGRAYMLAYEGEAEEKHITTFDGAQFTVLAPGKDFPAGLAISCLAFDARGQLVIGADEALAIQRGGDWKVYERFGKTAPAPHVYDIAVDGDTLWLGTPGGVWELRDDRFTLHKTSSLAKCLCHAGDTLWIGVSYGGLARLRGGELTVRRQADSALPHDDVEHLALGRDGTLWVHAGQDLARVHAGVLERKPAAAPRPRKLLAFPKRPLVARKLVPGAVVDLITEDPLAAVTPDQLLALIRPAIAFDLLKYKSLPVGASKFGGQPDLPSAMKWPTFADDKDRVLPFVLQFNLAEVHAHDKEGLLPAKGMLYFFSDTSPDELGDARVLYTDVPITKLVRRAFPEDLVDRARQADFIAQVPEYKVELTPVFTLPSAAFLRGRAELGDDDAEALQALATALIKLASKKLPAQCSRLLGWPDRVQHEVVETTDEIALLQLNGCELSPKGIEKVFAHWSGDGLIHFVLGAADLAKKKFERAAGSMACT
jgi:hypothetical protein